LETYLFAVLETGFLTALESSDGLAAPKLRVQRKQIIVDSESLKLVYIVEFILSAIVRLTSPNSSIALAGPASALQKLFWPALTF